MYDIPVFAPHKYCARYLEMSLTYTDGIRWMTIFMYHGIYVLLQGTMVPKTCMGIPWYYKCFYPSFISSQLISWYLLSLECLSSCKCTDYTLSDAFIIVTFCILYSELLSFSCCFALRESKLHIPVLTSPSQLLVAIPVVPQAVRSFFQLGPTRADRYSILHSIWPSCVERCVFGRP